MKETKVSIIIPHYNSPAMLETLIKSIVEEATLLAATESIQPAATADTPTADASAPCPLASLIQVIITDDNSTKDVELYNDVKDRYTAAYPGAITFLRNLTGKNASGTCRNFGLEAATGDWILFADADDYFLPGWYQTVEDYLESDYDLVHFCAITVDKETGEPTTREDFLMKGLRSYGEPDGWDEYDLRMEFHPPWSKLIRHDLIKEHDIKFPPSLWGDDTVFSIQIGTFAKKIHMDKREIYCLVEAPTNVTRIYSPVSLKQLMHNSATYDAFVRKHYSNGAELLREHGQLAYHVTSYLFAMGSKGIVPVLRLMGSEALHFLKEHGVEAIRRPCRQHNRCVKAIATGKPIYIYGAGIRGRRFLQRLEYLDGVSNVKAFVVTDTLGNQREVEGIPVVGIDSILPLEEGSFLMVAIKEPSAILSLLEEKGVKEYEIF